MTESMLVDAGTMALAWSTVASASGDDPDAVALAQTVNVEIFHGIGLRLTATDSAALASAFVPFVQPDGELAAEPPLDFEASSNVTVVDKYGRAAKLCAFALKLAREAKAKDDESPTMRFEVQTTNADDVLDPSMVQRKVVLELPGRSRERLDTVEAPFPNWRGLIMNRRGDAPTDHHGYTPWALDRISKVAKAVGSPKIRFGYNGPIGTIVVDLMDRARELHVIALILPERLAEDRRTETPAERTSEATGNRFLDDLEAFLEDAAAEIDDFEGQVVKAARFVVAEWEAGDTAVAQHLGVGVAMAARVVDELERRGIVGPSVGVEPREVLVTSPNVLEAKLAQWAHLHEISAETGEPIDWAEKGAAQAEPEATGEATGDVDAADGSDVEAAAGSDEAVEGGDAEAA